MILDGYEVVAELIRYLSTFEDYTSRVTDDLYGKSIPDLLKESTQKEVIVVEHIDTDFENSVHGVPIDQVHFVDITILRATKSTDGFSGFRNSVADVSRDIIRKIKDPANGTLNMPDVDIEFTKSTPGEVMVGSVKCTAIILSVKVKTYFENPNIVEVSGYVKNGSGVGINGVTITFSNGGGTVITNSYGFYKKDVSYGYTGTAAPSLTGYTFNPVSLSYNGIITNQKNNNYIGTLNP